MKLKKFWSVGEARAGSAPPPKSATDPNLIFAKFSAKRYVTTTKSLVTMTMIQENLITIRDYYFLFISALRNFDSYNTAHRSV